VKELGKEVARERRVERFVHVKDLRMKMMELPMVIPSTDGWFLSDFYFFHHLFQGIGEF
jgi:hypothetical protein